MQYTIERTWWTERCRDTGEVSIMEGWRVMEGTTSHGTFDTLDEADEWVMEQLDMCT